MNYSFCSLTSNETATTKELWTRQLKVEGLVTLPYKFHSNLEQGIFKQ